MHLLGVGIKNFTAYLERGGGETDRQTETDRQREGERNEKKRGIRLRYQREREVLERYHEERYQRKVSERVIRERNITERGRPLLTREVSRKDFIRYIMCQREREKRQFALSPLFTVCPVFHNLMISPEIAESVTLSCS